MGLVGFEWFLDTFWTPVSPIQKPFFGHFYPKRHFILWFVASMLDVC